MPRRHGDEHLVGDHRIMLRLRDWNKRNYFVVTFAIWITIGVIFWRFFG